MIRFIGEYDSTLDAKGRFLFPVGYKKYLTEGEDMQFVINRGIEFCLRLYPIKTWNPLFDEITNLNDFDQDVRMFKRFFMNGAVEISPDSAGRLLIPQGLKEYAKLEKNIKLVSAGDKIEIWDLNKYKEAFEEFTPENYSALAQKVMVPKKISE